MLESKESKLLVLDKKKSSSVIRKQKKAHGIIGQFNSIVCSKADISGIIHSAHLQVGHFAGRRRIRYILLYYSVKLD